MDDEYRGLFATRAPNRPNQIGLSVVRLTKIEANVLYVKDLDVIEGTPLLDIKPYVAEFDRREDVRIGWLEDKVDKLPRSKDDGRFTE
jgi:tRNA (Thr-GGU) A37 N-methylase